jgi:hypothetical protein
MQGTLFRNAMADPGKRMKLIVLAGTLVVLLTALALYGGAIIEALRGPAPRVTNQASAQRAAAAFFQKKAGAGDEAGLLPIEEPLLRGRWLFGRVNFQRPLLGGPAFWDVCYVPHEALTDGTNVTGSLAAIFLDVLGDKDRVPKTDAEALEFAKCYVGLTSLEVPARVVFLKEGEVPAGPARQGVTAKDITALSVSRAESEAAPGTGVYTLTFCARTGWGDICRWRVVIGWRQFTVQADLLYRKPRILM